MPRTFELPIEIWNDLLRKVDDDILTHETAAIIVLRHCHDEYGDYRKSLPSYEGTTEQKA